MPSLWHQCHDRSWKGSYQYRRKQLSKRTVIALAITILTVCPLIHMLSRRGGIWINNGFAIIKVALLFVIFILGWVHAAGSIKSKGINEAPWSELPKFQHPAMNITSGSINTPVMTTSIRHFFFLEHP